MGLQISQRNINEEILKNIDSTGFSTGFLLPFLPVGNVKREERALTRLGKGATLSIEIQPISVPTILN